MFNGAANAQETEAASTSSLTGIALPSGAQRVLPGSVPVEVTEALDKIIAAGGGKVQKGDTEVLVWAGANYKKANATATINRLVSTLKAAGWQYSIEGEESGMTVFSAFKEGARRRAVVGFHGATDDALVFSWMEILPAGTTNNQVESNAQIEDITPVRNSSGGSIVGTWTNGTTSMNYEQYQNGTTAFRNGSTYKYVFKANGSFEFVGLMASTMYGCTTTLFNDKRGKYQISGNQITFIPSKNYWKNTYSCSPASNKERDYTLERETYEFRTKQDEYGKTLVCLANAKGEACYRRED